jgi:hypothetical protein
MAEYRKDPRYVPAYRRYPSPLRQSTSALTVKIVLVSVVATLVIGGMIAVQMAAGSDPALGPKAAARAKKASAARNQNSASSSQSSGTDPYSQSYGYGGEGSYGDSGGYGGYSGGSSGSSSSGSSGYSYSPPPVTSSTS